MAIGIRTPSTESSMLNAMKTNPFPWFPWWPKVEESHYIPIVVVALFLAAILIYFAGI